MQNAERERKSRRIFYLLILVLLLLYAAIKTHHILLAMDAYRGQPLEIDTTGAAK
jgi:hypothetical protein